MCASGSRGTIPSRSWCNSRPRGKTGQSKVRSDALKARKNYEFKLFVYLTSRRIPPETAQPILDKLWEDGIAARIVDAQMIASAITLARRTDDLLDALGVRAAASAEGGIGRPRNLREDLAYAYAFFGTDTNDFREAVLDRAIVGYITRSGGHATRDTIVRSVGRALNLNGERNRLVAARVDRMLQQGELVLEGAELKAAERLVEAHKAARIVRGRQWRVIQDEVMAILGSAGLAGAELESGTAAVSEAAGALMLAAGSSAAGALISGGDAGPGRREIRAHLLRLERDLGHTGLDPDKIADTTTALAEAISNSEIGQTLLAGHLFLSLAGMEPSALIKALGGSKRLDVVLDASVAIPMLASLLYEPLDTHDFNSAHYAYEQAVRYEAGLMLPHVYLEETASHLLNAYDEYRPLVEADVDLRHSKNAFVAHYETLRHLGKCKESFDQYVANFGLRLSTGLERDFRSERDWIMGRMQSLFSQYGIRVAPTRKASQAAIGAARSAVLHTVEELELDRPGHLLDHDISTIAEVLARTAAEEEGVVLCSWDRLHLQLQTTRGPVEWNAADPAMLGDLFALLSDQEDAPIGGAVEVALEMGDDEARRAAQIWDQLVSIEKDGFYDAELRRRAKAFVDDYLQRERAEPQDPVSKDWAEWKSLANA
jgi:hypothetical protein